MRGSLFILICCLSCGSPAAELQNVRMWSAPERTRVVFDVTEPREARVFTMANPDRLVIDLAQTEARAPLSLPRTDPLRVKNLRYARRGAGGLRVVLDLKRPVTVNRQLLHPNEQYGHRLVFDLFDQEPVAPPPPATRADDRPRDIVVAIDAGHGGEDVGAVGPSGLYEKDIVFAVASRLHERINRAPGMRSVLIRDGDYYVGLRQRMDLARRHKADLFVSIHADAFRDRRVRGSSVYVLSQRGASSEAARWLAENENASDLVGGVTLGDKDDVLKSVLIDLSQTASIDASVTAAEVVLRALNQLGTVHRKQVQHAGFAVLKSPDIPSVLVETAFISNPVEEKKLGDKNYQGHLAGALFNGIYGYFQRNTPPGTKLAAQRRHRVVRGETLSAIANHYDVSTESIKVANNIRGDLLKAGAVLTIP